MAVRRKRAQTNRTREIKTKQAAALRHNAKLVTLTKHARPVPSHEGRARRIKNVQRRQQGRRKPLLERDVFQFLPKGLDPRTWLRSRGGSRRKRVAA
jgi:hypothetical protein